MKENKFDVTLSPFLFGDVIVYFKSGRVDERFNDCNFIDKTDELVIACGEFTVHIPKESIEAYATLTKERNL